ncbi:hypothetical protein KDA_15890 [Dictyobacter alpinus]|uniref:Uncharacterized protein n=1 Tax=Dictyobacter alpinus TaxID=2014873 RepID=A0A402B428_9CHLR|nr:hypothetical protein KDA_15890 [Dictyobacter alpinus]
MFPIEAKHKTRRDKDIRTRRTRSNDNQRKQNHSPINPAKAENETYTQSHVVL